MKTIREGFQALRADLIESSNRYRRNAETSRSDALQAYFIGCAETTHEVAECIESMLAVAVDVLDGVTMNGGRLSSSGSVSAKAD